MHVRRRPAHALLIAALTLGPAACSSPARPAGTRPLTFATARGTVSLEVRIADTAPARERGLMRVRSLGQDEGMAFLYDGPVEQPYWMKDTLLPLSIAFWGRDHRIVSILDMTPCPRAPCPLYRAGRPFVGAVEANRGFFSAHDIRVGDRVALGG